MKRYSYRDNSLPDSPVVFRCWAEDILRADQILAAARRMGTVQLDPKYDSVVIDEKGPIMPSGTVLEIIQERAPAWLGDPKRERKALERIGDLAEYNKQQRNANAIAQRWKDFLRSLNGPMRGTVERICFYCGSFMLEPPSNGYHHPRSATRDHIHPRSKGGSLTVKCCAECNNLKRTLLLEQWRIAICGTVNGEFFGEMLMRVHMEGRTS